MTDKKTVDFWTTWKIRWPEITTGEIDNPLTKIFFTSHNNVVFHWQLQLCIQEVSSGYDRFVGVFVGGPRNRLSFEFSLLYEDGPGRHLKIGRLLYIVKAGQTWPVSLADGTTAVTRGHRECIWSNASYRSLESFRYWFSLAESEPLIFRIGLRIPVTCFSFNIRNPLPIPSPPKWIVDLFCEVEDEGSLHSNAKFISNQGAVFRVVKAICNQSPPLDEKIHSPLGHGNPPNEYNFPDLDTTCLRALIEYLYTGQTNLEPISTAGIMDLADASKQYDLEPLSRSCCSILWTRVVDMPELAFHIARYAAVATHDDMKYLKDRAMDILADNLKKVSVQSANLIEEFGGGNEGKLLLGQFCFFLSERVEPF